PNRSDRDRPAMTIGIRGKHTKIKSEVENITSLLARVFREETERPTYGWDEDFYSVGGHDETALRVLARVREDHGVTVPLGDGGGGGRFPWRWRRRVSTALKR